jgi:hypothetical protein
MRRTCSSVAVLAVLSSLALAAQTAEREVIAVISGPALAGGIVSELTWDGSTIVIQSVVMKTDGTLSPKYFAAAGPRAELRPIAGVPAAVERYWRRKASRTSPTGFGKITSKSDAKMPLYGIASLERRMLDAVDMGGTIVMHELMIGDLVIHRRRDVEPYDGEVWSWSPLELNRVAYVDEAGDVFVARADGKGSERIAKGDFTLPAWSEDGRLLAVAERKDRGKVWEISILHVPERFRR